MSEDFASYGPSLVALGSMGGIYLLQLLVTDVVAILKKHVPGTPINASHDDLLFRTARAHANTTESIGALILISIFAISVGGDPPWVNASLSFFVGFRVLHMTAYYIDFRTLRSVAFGLSILALFVLLATAFAAL